MKCVVLQGDGMGDEPIADLGGKTPLEAARTPNLDRMASRGILGLTRTIPQGIAPASEAGSMALLGYDPARYRTGCAPVEAVSLGVPLGPADVAFRCNLVTREVLDDGIEIMRDFAGGHPPNSEAHLLVADLARALGGDGIELYPGVGYRHLLVWRNGEQGMRTIPPHTISEKPVAPAMPEGPGAERLQALMSRASGILAAHPVCEARRARGERAPTSIWLWGQGTRTTLPSLRSRFGIEGSVVAALDHVRGLGMMAGLRVLDVPGATGDLDTNFRGKAERGLAALDDRDFVWINVGAATEGGHSGDPQKKITAIEQFDEHVVGPVLEGLRQRGGEWRVMVAPDHPTPCATRGYTAEPVPFVVYVARDEEKARGQKRSYHERDAREQGIFIPEGHTLVERLLRV
ncbi:MAG TPA: cofactor-independent phosphoglycerate mutase [Candidatus Binatia bacterium]|jgi:2,3-bisphosphoglycerate-independent phosphoglycerate mutase|nr:cofactor-independent phosphoglycerate mutase [Candidatus Binatia bacterium]